MWAAHSDSLPKCIAWKEGEKSTFTVKKAYKHCLGLVIKIDINTDTMLSMSTFDMMWWMALYPPWSCSQTSTNPVTSWKTADKSQMREFHKVTYHYTSKLSRSPKSRKVRTLSPPRGASGHMTIEYKLLSWMGSWKTKWY